MTAREYLQGWASCMDHAMRCTGRCPVCDVKDAKAAVARLMLAEGHPDDLDAVVGVHDLRSMAALERKA